jgi:hypothetical protein
LPKVGLPGIGLSRTDPLYAAPFVPLTIPSHVDRMVLGLAHGGIDRDEEGARFVRTIWQILYR